MYEYHQQQGFFVIYWKVVSFNEKIKASSSEFESKCAFHFSLILKKLAKFKTMDAMSEFIIKYEGYLQFSKSDEDDSRLIVNDYAKKWNEQQAHTSPLNILTLDAILIPKPFLVDRNTQNNSFEKNEMTQQSLHGFLRGLDKNYGLVYCRSNTHISIFYFQKDNQDFGICFINKYICQSIQAKNDPCSEDVTGELFPSEDDVLLYLFKIDVTMSPSTKRKRRIRTGGGACASP